MPVFQLYARRLYLAIAETTWSAVLIAFAAHLVVSYALYAVADEEGLTGNLVTYLYYYVTTATTVGYGDLSPVTQGGRIAALLFVLPGSIALFGAALTKAISDLGDFWRKRMNGMGDYSSRTGHTVVLGWQGVRSRRLVELLLADQPAGERIVLVSKSLEQNPDPEHLDFVRADALSTPKGQERAGLAGARSILVRGDDDDETLAATLAAASAAPDAHIAAYFEDERSAELISRQCPRVEAIGSLSAELLVRSSRDPGASRVADLLFSAKTEDTAFSMRVPADAPGFGYLDAFGALKRAHDMTLVGVGNGQGDDVDLNCPAERRVTGGETIYYIADERLSPDAIDWRALDAR